MRTNETPIHQNFTLDGILHVEPMIAAHAVANESALLVDVREEEEVSVIHFDEDQDYVHIPLLSLAGRLNELPKDRPLILVCNDGVRSTKAVNLLRYQGLSSCFNLDGGIIQWYRDGLPVVLREDITNHDNECGTPTGCSGCGGGCH